MLLLQYNVTGQNVLEQDFTFFSLVLFREIIFVQVKSRMASSADSVMTVRLLKREPVFQYKNIPLISEQTTKPST